METRSVRLSQVFPRRLENLTALPTSLSALSAGREALSLGEQGPDPSDLWVRAGPEGDEAGGALGGLRGLFKGGKLLTSYRPRTWVSKEIMPGTFPKPCNAPDASFPFSRLKPRLRLILTSPSLFRVPRSSF